MKRILTFLLFLLGLSIYTSAQNTKGIHLQAIARNQNGMIIPNKQITLRLSIISDTSTSEIEYQEIKSVTTNMLGLFFIEMGADENGKIITTGDFKNIPWNKGNYFLHVEIDPNNSLSFVSAGIEKINYVPLALYADKANTVNSIIPIEFGGTGVASIKEIVKILNIDKINNSPDSLKSISIATGIVLNEKLKKSDTITLSNRINLKLNSLDTLSLSTRINSIPKLDTTSMSNRINLKLSGTDTLKLSNRINLKLNSIDTLAMSARISQKLNTSDTLNLSSRINAIPKIDTSSLSNRINSKISAGALNNTDILTGLGYSPVKNNYGLFYDTSRQATTIATATAVKFYFQHLANKINVTTNTSGNPTRISVGEAGIYQLNYSLQLIKSDAGTDELNVWIRRNSSAYPNTNYFYTLLGAGVKNIITGFYYIDLGVNDYVELYFSVKNANSVLTGTPSTTVTPSRPATPSAFISLHAIN
jgi:hypothetical protein